MEEYHCLLRTKFVVVCGREALRLCEESTRAYVDGDEAESDRLRDQATAESLRYAREKHYVMAWADELRKEAA